MRTNPRFGQAKPTNEPGKGTTYQWTSGIESWRDGMPYSDQAVRPASGKLWAPTALPKAGLRVARSYLAQTYSPTFNS